MPDMREYQLIFAIQDSDSVSEGLRMELIQYGLSSVLLRSGVSSTMAVYAGGTLLSDEQLVSDLEELIAFTGDIDHGMATLVVSNNDGRNSHYAMPEEGGHFLEISNEEFEELNREFPGMAP